MRSLLDIQQDIRSLEQNLRSVALGINKISYDIEQLRNSEKNTGLDFSKIKLLAQKIPFSKHPLKKLDDGYACQIYLEMLLNIVRLDADPEITSINRLVFIQWLQIHAEIDWSLERLLKDCYKMQANDYHEFCEIIPKMYRETFMVDALIVANIGGNANREIYEYIAELSVILDIDKESMRILSLAARVILCQNMNCVNKNDMNEFLNRASSFKSYIRDILKVTQKHTLENQRFIAVEIKVSDTATFEATFEWTVKQRQKVNKGDVIAVYHNQGHTIRHIQAPISGTLFYFMHNSLHYGVISDESDNIDSIKEWIKILR